MSKENKTKNVNKIKAIVKSMFTKSRKFENKKSNIPAISISIPHLLFTSYQIFSSDRVLRTLNPYKILGGIFFKINGIANIIYRKTEIKPTIDKTNTDSIGSYFPINRFDNKDNLINLFNEIHSYHTICTTPNKTHYDRLVPKFKFIIEVRLWSTNPNVTTLM